MLCNRHSPEFELKFHIATHRAPGNEGVVLEHDADFGLRAFCQAMVHDPKVMLLDEPLGKLDAMTRERIRTDLQQLWMQQRPTVTFVTHSIEEAVQLSTHVAVITPRPGRVDLVIPIDLPFPRDLDVKNSRPFVRHVREIQEIFRGFGVI
jgi:NitT/TauT family transport system ATP-binding protein